MKAKQRCMQAWPQDRRYEVIVADPPWPYPSSGAPTWAGTCAYETLSMEALGRLPVASLGASNSVLLMWTTGPFLTEAAKLMARWRYTYKTVFLCWHKVTWPSGRSRLGPGHYSRPSCEFLLLGTRGCVASWRESRAVSQWLEVPASGHSRKPEASLARIEACFGAARRKIELFARGRYHRDGWDSWGLQNEPYFYSTRNVCWNLEILLFSIGDLDQFVVCCGVFQTE